MRDEKLTIVGLLLAVCGLMPILIGVASQVIWPQWPVGDHMITGGVVVVGLGGLVFMVGLALSLVWDLRQ